MKADTRTFKATLSLFDATAIGIGAIIGAGIFVVTGIAAGLAGPALIVSIVIAGLVSLFTALSVVELSARITKEGGIYAYAAEMLSPFAGFLTGWTWVVSNIFVGAAVALGFGHYFVAMFPIVSVKLVASVLCVIMTGINISGSRQSSLVNNVLVIVKLAVLVLFAVVGSMHIKSANLVPFKPLESGVISGAYFIFFAFGGFARIAVLAEEVKDA